MNFKQIANNYEIFKELYFALKGTRVLQTYGKIKQIKDEELDDIINKQTDNYYFAKLIELGKVEEYKEEYNTIKQVKEDASSGTFTFISRNSILKEVFTEVKKK